MIRAILPYLHFAGNAGEAIEHYQKALGAEVVTRMHWRDMPDHDAAKTMGDQIMHATLTIGDASIMLCDLPAEMMAGGGRMTVMVQCDAPSDVDRFFDALVEGGKVMMPVADTFWGARFGHCVDRFGIGWQFNCQLNG